MKPMKYNYEEHKLKKMFMGKYTLYRLLYMKYVFIKHGFVFIAFLIVLSFSVFHFSALYRRGGGTTTCHTMKGLAHLNIDVARGDESLTDPRGLSRHNVKHRNSVHDRHKNSKEKQIKRELF